MFFWYKFPIKGRGVSILEDSAESALLLSSHISDDSKLLTSFCFLVIDQLATNGTNEDDVRVNFDGNLSYDW